MDGLRTAHVSILRVAKGASGLALPRSHSSLRYGVRLPVPAAGVRYRAQREPRAQSLVPNGRCDQGYVCCTRITLNAPRHELAPAARDGGVSAPTPHRSEAEPCRNPSRCTRRSPTPFRELPRRRPSRSRPRVSPASSRRLLRPRTRSERPGAAHAPIRRSKLTRSQSRAGRRHCVRWRG